MKATTPPTPILISTSNRLEQRGGETSQDTERACGRLWQWISVDTAQRGLHDVSCWELGLCGGLARMRRPKGGGGGLSASLSVPAYGM